MGVQAKVLLFAQKTQGLGATMPQALLTTTSLFEEKGEGSTSTLNVALR